MAGNDEVNLLRLDYDSFDEWVDDVRRVLRGMEGDDEPR